MTGLTRCRTPATQRRVTSRTLLFISVTALLFISMSVALLSIDTSHVQGDGSGPLLSGSRAPYVHRITLYDHDGEAIDPDDPEAAPYSPARTCGKCHPYEKIRHGFHFNADLPEAQSDTPSSEPRFFVDAPTQTVLPLAKTGPFSPSAIGLSRWEYTLRFGAHSPGGGIAEPSRESIDASDEALRWDISGTLEIDCMICHSRGSSHDPAEANRQIGKQNFKWIPTVALGLGTVRGEARKVPDDYDPLDGPNPDFPELSPPTLEYDAARFDGNARVHFDVVRRPDSDRCYFCHTQREVGARKRERWHGSHDIHMSSGMSCADCHRNDIGHDLVRGYPQEVQQRQDARRAAFSCEGCHLGGVDSTTDASALLAQMDPETRRGGRHGAPRPQHAGLPPIHFEKLSCSACHSGAWPQRLPQQVQTSLAHQLGLPSKTRLDADAPKIYQPWLQRDKAGVISATRAMWPSYWGTRIDADIRPLTLKELAQIAPLLKSANAETITTLANPTASRVATPGVDPVGDDTAGDDTDPRDNTATSDAATQAASAARSVEEKLAPLLLQLQQSLGFEVLRVQEGWQFESASAHAESASEGASKALRATPSAPVTWPLGHDVRPAAQALGATGCQECHSEEGAVFFGTLPGTTRTLPRYDAETLALMGMWNPMFQWRSVFKALGWICTLLLLAILIAKGRAAPNEALSTECLSAEENSPRPASTAPEELS